MPQDMVIDNLSVTSIDTSPRKKTDDPNLPLVIPIPKKKVTVDLRGIGKDTYNIQVQQYQEKLKSEESLVSMLDDITYIKQTVRPDKPEESYTMNFILDKKKK